MAIRTAIIGLGFFGQYLLPIIRKTAGIEVVALYNRSSKRQYEIDGMDARFYTDLDLMFDQEKLDAVFICDIPSNHLRSTRLAAERGINVFCEKPMASNLEDCDEMVRVCCENNVKLMIGYKHRFSKSTKYVFDHLSQLGKPLWAMYTYPLWKVGDSGWKFREDGTKGIIVENMVHAFDVMRYLFGEVKSIYAEGDNYMFKDVKPPDSAICVMRFMNGAIGSIGGGCTGDQRVSEEYLDMHFENGIAQISGKLDKPFNLRMLFRASEEAEIFNFKGSDGICEEIEYFADCIINNINPSPTGKDGKKALELALAAIESIRNHSIIKILE